MGYSYNPTDLFKAKEKMFNYSEPNLTLEIRGVLISLWLFQFRLLLSHQSLLFYICQT
jgi:hypothetical protein